MNILTFYIILNDDKKTNLTMLYFIFKNIIFILNDFINHMNEFSLIK